MSNKDLNIALKIRADLRQAITQLQNLDTTLNNTDIFATKAGKGLNSAANSTERFRKEASHLPALLARIGALMATAFSVKEIGAAVETYTQIRNRLSLVTKSSEELASAQDAVFQAAQDARQPLSATAELYQRIATNADALKLSGAGVASVVNTINKNLAISGTSGASSEAALVQLGQAFASGTLRGEELNSVLEQAPALAKTLADGLGVTVGQLRQLGEEGKLTAQNVIQALQSQSGKVDEQFKKIAVTGSQALTVLGNSLIKVVGELDAASGSSTGFANIILELSNWIDSGQLTEGLIASLNIWSGVMAAIGGDIESLGGDLDGLSYAGGETIKFLIQAFKEMPANLRSAVQITTVEILAIFDKTIAYANYAADTVDAAFSSKTQEQAAANLEKRLQEIDGIRTQGIATILAERDAILEGAAAGEKSRSEERAARAKAREEREKEIAALRDKAANSKVSFGVDPEQAKAAEKYVKNLEQQAKSIGATTEEIHALENAEKKLSPIQLQRAQVAQKAIDQEKEKNQLAAIQIELLHAQGKEQDAVQLEFKQRYDDFLNKLTADNKEAGKKLVSNLLDYQLLKANLDKAKEAIDRILDDQQQKESNINTLREAGLITQAEAQRRIVDLHRQTYEQLDKQRPVLEELAKRQDEVGIAARAALAELNNQALILETTMDRLETTLRNGVESGLTDALEGLAKGTYSFRDAIGALATTVADSIIRMGAEDIAQWATSSLFNLGKKDSGESMKEAAVAMTSSAAIWTGVAAQITAAATSLAAAGGGSGGTGGTGGTASLISSFASLFAADGGHVRGPGTTTSDSIPTMLSNYEYVTRAAVVMQPGALDFLHDFNRRGMAALSAWAPAFHNTGGLAGYPAPAMPSPSIPAALTNPSVDPGSSGGAVNNRIYNILDPELLGDYLHGPAGDKFIINWMKRNTSLVQRFAGVKN